MPKAERGFFRRIINGAGELLRGHTPEDEERVRRIVAGKIIPEDTNWYSNLRWQQKIVPRPMIDPLTIVPQTNSPWMLGDAIAEIQRLANLPPEELAIEITAAAQEQARAWGLLPPDGAPPPPQ